MKKLNLNENFIARIWGEKAFYDSPLTTDGQKIEVLDFGRLNKDSGADFKNAKIKVGETVYRGDVEIHRSVKDWNLHGHKKNGKYNRVILQVVFWGEDFPTAEIMPSASKSRKIPTVILSRFLSKSIHEIWKDIINNPSSNIRLPCKNENDSLSGEFIQNWIDNLALKRLNYRAGRIKDRIEELVSIHGGPSKPIWEQVFFEYVCEALGFSKNKEQFLKLSRNIDIQTIRKNKFSPFQIDALLYGSAGFLTNLKFKHKYIEELKIEWSQIRESIKPRLMNSEEWNFFRLRPMNFPTIRIAYASAFLCSIINNDMLKRIFLCFENSDKTFREVKAIFEEPKISEYWENHYTFGKETVKHPTRIGETRISDIITNVLLPFILYYSKFYEKNNLHDKVIKYFSVTKESNKNEVTRVMEEQLKFKIRSVSDGQGVIHLHNFFCIRQKCRDCAIGRELYQKDAVSDVLRIILY
ncbi:DUF2851 family protein [bacterium]|nr:MAG: DUF2851 family protein [bacterium]